MSKNENRDCDIIPPSVGPVIVLATVSSLYYIWQIRSFEGPYAYMQGNNIPMDILIILAAIDSIFFYGRSFVLTKDNIVCRVLWIPYRTILWTDVIQAGIARQGGTIRLSSSSNCIILTLNGCAKYRPGKDVGGNYNARHPLKTIMIHETKHFVTLVEKYYGTLDYGYDRINPLK